MRGHRLKSIFRLVYNMTIKILKFQGMMIILISLVQCFNMHVIKHHLIKNSWQSRVAHTVDSILPEGHIQLGKPSTQKTILAHMLAAAVFKIPPWYSMPGQVLNQTFKTFSLVLQSLDYTTSIGWWQYSSGWD